MVSASHVQSPAQGGGSQIAFQWLHYTHCEHCSQHNSLRALLENTICEPMVEGLIMWWGHIIHRGVWERLRYGSPLPPNESQTMFKGTIKIFLQHFISGGDHINLIHMDVNYIFEASSMLKTHKKIFLLHISIYSWNASSFEFWKSWFPNFCKNWQSLWKTFNFF